jgi:D-glycero-alpha-D-manno-heptose-7-phosphate kinase
MVIRSRAPLRLGLAGGGSDISPFCDKYGGVVLNATIDMYAYSTIEPSKQGTLSFAATDLQIKHQGPAISEFALDGELNIHKAIYNRIVRDFNAGAPLSIDVQTYCDAPVGSGLGSSSTLTVAILQSFVELLRLPLGEYDIANLAFDIERRELGLTGGKQDQYAATFGGFNFIEFYEADRVIVNPLRLKPWIISELESSLVLYFTGTSRSSAAIIDEQMANLRMENRQSLEASMEIKKQAIQMKEFLLKGDIKRFAEHMDLSWQQKKLTTEKVSNSQIDEVYRIARAHGALAGKVSGAGGGGFMMFIVNPSRRMEVIRALKIQTGQLVSCHFVETGASSWRIP